jgi:hypothetical protein
MDHINELIVILNSNFNWNKARITCFSKMLLALFVTRTVNLNKIACSMSSPADKTSRYRRLQRFFAEVPIDFEMVASFIFRLFFVTNGHWYLTMDRTNWKWGKTDINILTLGIAFKGIAIPIYWELLDKRGNSDTEERIALIQKFIHRFGKPCIAGLLADREFIGQEWFGWLIKEQIPFWIRVKDNLLTTDSRGRSVKIKALFRQLPLHHELSLYGKRNILGHELYVAGMRLVDGDYLIVVTPDYPGKAISQYSYRWEIETLFSCLKGRGFNFEDTHMTELQRVKKLMTLLAIAFCWAHKTGEWYHEVKPIKIKTHRRPAISLFRYGLDYIVDILMNLFYKKHLFSECLDKIKPPHLDYALHGAGA